LKTLLQNRPIFRIVFYCWLVFITISSLIPNISTKGIEEKLGTELRLDYFIHFFIYFILAYAFIMQFSKKEKIKRSDFIWIILGGIIYGVGLEGLQLIIPGRAFNFLDIVFNTLGIVSGLLVSNLILNKTSKNLN
jgi:VanZ family protein